LPSELFPFRPRSLQAAHHTFAQSVALECREHGENAYLEPSGRGAQIESVSQTDESHAELSNGAICN